MEKSYEYLLDRWHEGVEMQRTVDYGDPKSVRRFNRGSDIYNIILNPNLVPIPRRRGRSAAAEVAAVGSVRRNQEAGTMTAERVPPRARRRRAGPRGEGS